MERKAHQLGGYVQGGKRWWALFLLGFFFSQWDLKDPEQIADILII
jgi:hypothetical protein